MEQVERAFQKQSTVFLNSKNKNKKPNKLRVCRNIGMGFVTPSYAKTGDFIDKKCPFTGHIRIRGRIMTGVIRKMKMQRTVVVRRDYLHYIKKYRRYEKRHKNTSAHLSPAFRDVNVGDVVTIGECRPLAKTVRYNVIKVNRMGGGDKEKKLFEKF